MSFTSKQQRVLLNVHRNTETGCWDWTGQVSNSGYGRTKVKGEDGVLRMQSADHASYEAFVGEVPNGLLVKPGCNNRLCVNPEHLELIDPHGRH